MESFDCTIAYTIFNKGFLLERIIKALKDSKDCQIMFFFDNCTDDSIEQFHRYRGLLGNCRAFVNSNYDFFETRANNFLLRNFRTKYCLLVQDDMVLSDLSLVSMANEVYSDNSKVGLVGFKDGYEMDIPNQYYNFISAPWSTSKFKGNSLSPGQYEKRTFVNRGPLCVSKEVINEIGFFDEAFYPLFWDDNDLSIRCVKSGFDNFVAYGKILTKHEWGATRSGSKICCRDINISNQYRFSKKWGFKSGQLTHKKTIIPRCRSLLMKLRLHLIEIRRRGQVFEITK